MKKHQTNSSHRTKLALAGVALIAAIVFYVIGNNSPQAAVGNIASVSVSKGVVTFPANTNVSQFQFHVYQVINGTRALITSQPSFGLSAAADPTISAPNRTFSTLATATNPSGAFQVRNGGTYDIEIKHPSLINAATGFGCFARFIVPNSGTSFVLTDGQFLTGSTRLLDRISFPCSGTPTPTSTSTSTASATPVTTGTLPAICSKPKLDVMLVMDNSGSMNNPSNNGPVSSVLMKDMIGAFINDGQGVSKYQAGDRIGGIRFAWDGNNDLDKTHTSDSFAASKAIMQLSGSTITDT
ncbi:MAG TPA: VWA domain-containing protein, partial [Patescibacteria group bacterium]